MNGLYIDGRQLAYREDLSRPVPAPCEALIRILLAGICRTDLELLRGYRPFHGVPGHEFVGIVESCSDEAWVGQRVVGEINIPCRACDLCQRGLHSHCRRRAAIGIFGHDGAMAEYMTLPIDNLHPVPAGVEDRQAVFTEPLAAALQILQQIHILPEERVVVLGDGRLGLLVAQVLALTGCRLTVVGHHAEKLAILEHKGLSTRQSIDGLHGTIDVAVECTGRPDGFEEARQLLRPRGRLVLKSTYASRTEVDLSRLVVDEITLIGSRCGPFEPALRLLSQGLLDVTSLISEILPLSTGLRAFDLAEQKGMIKILLQP